VKNFKGYLMEGARELYYEDQFQEWNKTKWNHSPVAVGWLDGRTNQAKRFETLVDIGIESGDSVLDVGCGVGHLIDHFNNIGLEVQYTGLDTNRFAIEQAKKIYVNETFVQGTLDVIDETYDWGLASGVFNYEFPKLEMLETVNQLVSKVDKGVAFNLLNGSKKYSSESYEYYQPVEIFSLLNRRGALCSVVQNYGIENDFTIYIRKQ
jgi:SAM-dependent methyltransferase